MKDKELDERIARDDYQEDKKIKRYVDFRMEFALSRFMEWLVQNPDIPQEEANKKLFEFLMQRPI